MKNKYTLGDGCAGGSVRYLVLLVPIILIILLCCLSCKSTKSYYKDCYTLGVAYEDKPINGVVFYRDWSVINWCEYLDTEGKSGIWEFRETLYVKDREEPTDFPNKLKKKYRLL